MRATGYSTALYMGSPGGGGVGDGEAPSASGGWQEDKEEVKIIWGAGGRCDVKMKRREEGKRRGTALTFQPLYPSGSLVFAPDSSSVVKPRNRKTATA